MHINAYIYIYIYIYICINVHERIYIIYERFEIFQITCINVHERILQVSLFDDRWA